MLKLYSHAPNFCPIKIDLFGNTVWPQATGFQKLSKMETILGILNQLLFPHNVNASLAMLNETFSVIFKHRVQARPTMRNLLLANVHIVNT